MIKVRVAETDGRISRIRISGHAGYAESGKDLVCAAVSGITFGLLNAADALIPSAACSVGENMAEITVREPDRESELVMRTGLIQLQTIEETSQKYIDIKMEV